MHAEFGFAIAAPEERSPSDSTLAVRADTTAIADTLERMSTPALLGTVDFRLESSAVRTREDLHWLDYRYLGGILESYPGTFVRDQYGEGQYSQLTVNGQDWRSIAVLANGRILNDPATGVYNLYLFPTEYTDRIEVVSGPRAFLYGLNSTGATVNLQTKNYNSNRPFTKLNYAEGVYGSAYTDGTFAQNISRRMNVTVGFQHKGADGRLRNSSNDTWLSREKLRFNLSHDINMILAHAFSSAQTGLNGGVDVTKSGKAGAFDVFPVVRNSDSYEKTTRHDFDASFVGTIFGDTLNVSMITLYYSSAFRQYRDEENRLDPNGITIHSDHTSSWMGGLLTQNLESEFQSFSLGANAELRQIEGSPNVGRRRTVIGSLWAKEEFHPTDGLDLAGFGRYDRYLGASYFSLGADAAIRVAGALTVTGGLSWSHRLPNFQELFWTDSTLTRTGPIAAETHRYFELGLTWTTGNAGSLSAVYFHRSIGSPILYDAIDGGTSPFPRMSITNGPTSVTNGVRAGVNLRFWVLQLEGGVTYLVNRIGGETVMNLPKLSGSGGLYFRHSLLNDKLDLKAGFKGRFATAHRGLEFNPEMVAYGAAQNSDLAANSSVDFFLIGHLGDAYIQFMWENLTNAKYFGTPFYPGDDRAIRFGISWEFLN
jgi:outer membrane cobalamin receptor